MTQLSRANPLPRAVLVLKPVPRAVARSVVSKRVNPTLARELLLRAVDPGSCVVTPELVPAPVHPRVGSLVPTPSGAVQWVTWAVRGGAQCPSECEHLSTSPSLSCSAEC